MAEDSNAPEQSSLSPDSTSKSETKNTKIYFDTNQLYYIRRISEESQGCEFGDYGWPNNPKLAQDIRALCYIVALQYEWDLDFCSSDAPFAEVKLRAGKKAQDTRDAWVLFAKGLKEDQSLRRVPFLPDWPVSGRLSLEFIDDPADRVILRHFASVGADVLLTSDDDILKRKEKLAELNLTVMRPYEWLNDFLKGLRGEEDAVDWLERILFGIRKG
jgi:predicted nucleic acid-binding protein